MELDKRLADGKAEAQPGGGIPCALLESIKNAAELVRLNPAPVSFTSTRSQPSESAVRMQIFPSSGVNFTALLSRFQKI